MNNQLNSVLSQEKAEKLADILGDAVKSYSDNSDKPVEEWLEGYLSRSLSDKNPDRVSEIVKNIVNAVELHDATIASLKSAIQSGQTVESWFKNETVNTNMAIGENAYSITESNIALSNTSEILNDESNENDIIDIEVIPAEEWNDDRWNSYRVKDLVLNTVQQASEYTLRNTATDLYQQATEYGLQSVLSDKEIIKESLINNASSGLKAAISGALEVADDYGVFPDCEADTFSRTMIASMSVENLRILSGIAAGEIDAAHGLGEIANTSISTLATIIKAKTMTVFTNVGKKIGATIGTVFGPVGTVVGNFVGGAVGKLAGTAVGSRVVETAKKVGNTARTVVSKVVNSARNFGNKIKSGLKKLFSW